MAARTESPIYEERYRRLFESAPDGILVLDWETRKIVDVNPFMTEFVGLAREAVLDKELSEIGLLGDDAAMRTTVFNDLRETGHIRLDGLEFRIENGEVRDVELVANAYWEGRRRMIQCSIRDVTARKRFERQLRYDALHDHLTGLANRTFFTEHLRKTLERAKRGPDELFAVLFLDFDRFKTINDSFGHAEGDNLLKQIARRLESTLRSSDLVARLCGDEFLILANKIADPADAWVIADHIRKNLEIPFEIGGGQVFITASIGIALSTSEFETAEEMLRDADLSMYRAKAARKARCRRTSGAADERAAA
jgi:diguanylate cyclase (GGDEF)-like protein/PAS domain S-box-containing protein